MHIAIALLLAVAAAQDFPKPVAVDERLVVELVAAEPELNTPVGVTVDAKGRVWVIESNTHFPPKNYKGRPADRILVFEDFKEDGRAGKVTTFAEGFRYGMGIGFHPSSGDLYFATRWEVYRWHGKPELQQQRDTIVKLETKGNYPHNGLSGFAFDAEGNVYFGMGENLGAPFSVVGSDGTTIKDTEGGKIFRCKPDGSGLIQIATGFWNPFHLSFDVHGRLFTVDNDPDSRPPCRLLHVIPGGDYGYKFRNGRKGLHPFTSWNGELPGTLPMVCGTGEAPSGVLAYQHSAFPEDYRGTLLATSWGDHILQKFVLEPKGASFTSTPQTIVKGGEHFRPVGIAMAPDGSIFVSDWVDRSYELHGKGRLWRIRPKVRGPQVLEVRAPNDRGEQMLRKLLSPAKKEELDAFILYLENPDPFIVSAAISTLARDGGAAWLLKHAKDPRPKVRLGVLMALRRCGDNTAVAEFLADTDVAVRRAAIQWVGEEKLGDFAAAMEKSASRLPVTKEIFEAYLASTDLLVGRNPTQVDQVGSEILIARVFDDANEPPQLRALALRMLRRDHPSLAVPKLEKLLESAPALKPDILQTLMTRPDEAAQAILRRSVDDAALRFDAVAGLSHSAATSGETRKVLLAQLDGPASAEAVRSLSGAIDRPEVKEALEKKGGELVAVVMGRPAGQPPTMDGWKKVAAEKGDAAAGGRLFFHPKGPQCSVCHRVNGRGGIVGADLSTIGNVLNRDRLVESILDPSREIAPMFVHWKVRTTKGDIVDGRILDEDSSPTGAVVFIDAQGNQKKVKNVDIEERQASKLSIMPEKLAEKLTRQDFRDLIEFLAGLK